MLSHAYALLDDVHATPTVAALRRAAEAIAGQAELLAGEMEIGAIADRGGADALRLLAALVRMNGHDGLEPLGHG